MTAVPFDVIRDDVTNQIYSLAGFLALPLGDRINLVMQRRLRFFASGVEVNRRLALKALMDAARGQQQ